MIGAADLGDSDRGTGGLPIPELISDPTTLSPSEAQAVVLGVLRERGRQGLPLTQLYRQVFNRELYLLAYGNFYSNQGAMTPGASEETADGMSEEKISQITGLMRNGLTLEHSSGAVEGNVTRVKRLKRDGYGRANFDLLRAQILIAA